MINKAILVGNLGADPEVRSTTSGASVCNFSVATTHRVKNGDEWEDATEWHRVVCFGRTAEFVGRYCSKGRQVYIEGRIQTRKWQDKDGNDRWSTEVVANEVKGLGGRNEDSDRSTPPKSRSKPKSDYSAPDDDVPF